MFTFMWLLLAGTYLLVCSIIMTTKNIPSAFLFKFVPLVLGGGLVLIALKNIGVL